MPLAQLPGAPFIAYADHSLYVEGVSLQALAQKYQTPLYVYSKAAMLHALSGYQRGLAGRRALVCYAMKANSSLAVLQIFARAGCGFDVVSGGELQRALMAGADPQKIVFSGVGKTREEMVQALRAGIKCFNVESLAEIDALNQVALGMACKAPVSLRINPNVDPKTHPYISTGLKDNKFGIAHEAALAAYRQAATLGSIEVVGIDCHIGSQITTAEPYAEAMDRLLDLVASIESTGIFLHHIDVGGGLGINYRGETPPAAEDLCQQFLKRIDERGYGDKELLLEPGRSLVGNAGVCLTQVLYTKEALDQERSEQAEQPSGKNFCIVDAAMNDLPRPAMYQAFHDIVPCQVNDAKKVDKVPAIKKYDVVGPVCESGDWLGRDRLLSVSSGDYLAVLSTGAYCSVMASSYNSRNKAAEVLVDGDLAMLIRIRETLDDQVRLEQLLPIS